MKDEELDKFSVEELRAMLGASGEAKTAEHPKPKDDPLDFLLNAAGIPKESFEAAIAKKAARPFYQTPSESLEQVASAGRFVNDKVQSGAQKMSDIGGVPGAAVGSVIGAASEMVLPKTKTEAALTLGAPIASKAMGPIAKAAAPKAKELAKGLLKIGPNIQNRTARFFLDNFDEVLSAPSFKEATEEYVSKLGGLKGAVKSLEEKTGKVVLDQADFADAINDAKTALSDKSLTNQDAVTAVQSINRFLKTTKFTKDLPDDSRRVMVEFQDDLYEFLEKNGNAGLRDAARKMRLASTKEAVTSLFPHNIRGDENVLRGLAGAMKIKEATEAAVAGNLGAAFKEGATGLFFSPAATTAAIRGAVGTTRLLSNPKATLGAVLATKRRDDQ